MTLSKLLARIGLASREADAQRLFEQLPAEAPEDWRLLAAALALRYADRAACVTLGVSGGQGAGKTTLSRLLEQALTLVGRRAVGLSLDDFYLTRAERLRLGETIHPLLATRGVPGTHDTVLARSVLSELKQGRGSRSPRFDKASDDRLPDRDDILIEAGVDVVIFEGWCVAARAQPDAALVDSLNDLERLEDPDGHWRRFVNARLAADYLPLWELLDEILYLQVPDLAAVIRWRTEQEQQHPPARRMSQAALSRFVAHYERLTLWMSQSLPAEADFVGFLDENHRLADFRARVEIASPKSV